MARFGGDASLAIEAVNNEKVYVTKQATSASTASVQLDNKNDADGLACMGSGNPQSSPLLVLQADQDFWYTFSSGAGATVTAQQAVKVTANTQEYVCPKPGRTFINLLQVSAAGTVSVFVVR